MSPCPTKYYLPWVRHQHVSHDKFLQWLCFPNETLQLTESSPPPWRQKIAHNLQTTVKRASTSVHDNTKHMYWSLKHTMYQRKVDVDMLNAVKSMLADVSSVSPSSELMLETSTNTLFTAFSISTSTLEWYIVGFTATSTQTKTSENKQTYSKERRVVLKVEPHWVAFEWFNIIVWSISHSAVWNTGWL